jgi:hypothetical protein
MEVITLQHDALLGGDYRQATYGAPLSKLLTKLQCEKLYRGHYSRADVGFVTVELHSTLGGFTFKLFSG